MSKLPFEKQYVEINTYKSKNKISSFTLICSASTSMIGTGILLYPLLYKDNGMILSQIIVSLIGLISYKTAQLCLVHIKDDEEDLTNVVLRMLGRKWHLLYCLTGSLYLALTSSIYYLLILNCLYSQIGFVYHSITGQSLIKKDVLTFSQFSFAYTNIIVLLIFVIIINLKNLKIIMKLGEYSFIGILVFFIFCLTDSFINIDFLAKQKNNPDFQYEEVKLFSDKFAVLAGSCAVAFNIHNMIVPIV